MTGKRIDSLNEFNSDIMSTLGIRGCRYASLDERE